jgi:RNA polymerase sigma-70 factor (ECF subfamily)
MTDHELIQSVIVGDRLAAWQFCEQFSGFVWAILLRDMGFDRPAAEELFQTVFERLLEDGFRRLRLWRGEGAFVSYLGPIVRNLGKDYLRAGARRSPTVSVEGDGGPENAIDPPDLAPGPEEQAIAQEMHRVVFQTLERLDPRDRELLSSRYLAEQSYRKIAETMNITVNNVGVALVRARDRLIRRLREDHPDLFPPPGGGGSPHHARRYRRGESRKQP